MSTIEIILLVQSIAVSAIAIVISIAGYHIIQAIKTTRRVLLRAEHTAENIVNIRSAALSGVIGVISRYLLKRR